MTALRFSAFLALLATAAATPPSAGSAGERALFGSSYGEACLFGSSSHLFGAPKPAVAKEEQDEDTDTVVVPVKATKTEQLEGAATTTAFVAKASPTAFVNHHPLYPSPLN